MNPDVPYTRTLEILGRLIGMPTVSAASNLELVDYAEDLLQGAGFRTQRMPDPVLPKAGLVARIGPEGPGGTLLSAHSDVVPAEGQVWTRPPFELTREGERFYGRGTTDMKGYLASMLAMAERAGRAVPTDPLMLVISYDEEVGCQGIARMVPGLKALGWQPGLCIVGEPTRMHPAIGHKGKSAYRAVFRGTAGHSALAPHFVNALHIAGDFLTVLRRQQESHAKTGGRDNTYTIPYSTVHAGKMSGGTALNIVPDKAEIEFEFRHLAADNTEAFEAGLESEVAGLRARWTDISPDAGVEISRTNAYPGFEVAPDAPEVARVAALCGVDTPVKVPFGTEAGFFRELGMPTIVCGPGDMEGQGHKSDEYIEVAQLAACDRMMDRILAGTTE